MIAQLSLPDQDKQSGEAQDAASPNMTMEVDWDLGVSGHSDDIAEEDEVQALSCLVRNFSSFSYQSLMGPSQEQQTQALLRTKALPMVFVHKHNISSQHSDRDRL